MIRLLFLVNNEYVILEIPNLFVQTKYIKYRKSMVKRDTEYTGNYQH